MHVCSHVYLLVYVFACVCVCMWVYTHEWTRISTLDLSSVSLTYFLRQGLSASLELTTLALWLVIEVKSCIWLWFHYLLQSGIPDPHHFPHLLHGFTCLNVRSLLIKSSPLSPHYLVNSDFNFHCISPTYPLGNSWRGDFWSSSK